MDSVSFIQQQIDEISLQMTQLANQRQKLVLELCALGKLNLLQNNNLTGEKGQVE